MKDMPENIPEKFPAEKRHWVTPDIQLISDSDIMSGSHLTRTENVFGGIFATFYGTNS
ncbi:MAG: hypothetical protein ACXVJD_16800 [Mucilaginibacter sp.]